MFLYLFLLLLLSVKISCPSAVAMMRGAVLSKHISYLVFVTVLFHTLLLLLCCYS